MCSSLSVCLFLWKFVAHPICQQVLSSIWCGNLAGWRGSRTAWKLFVSMVIFLTMPFLCLVYWVAPKSKVTSHENVTDCHEIQGNMINTRACAQNMRQWTLGNKLVKGPGPYPVHL